MLDGLLASELEDIEVRRKREDRYSLQKACFTCAAKSQFVIEDAESRIDKSSRTRDTAGTSYAVHTISRSSFHAAGAAEDEVLVVIVVVVVAAAVAVPSTAATAGVGGGQA